jgi:hypothetical protein
MKDNDTSSQLGEQSAADRELLSWQFKFCKLCMRVMKKDAMLQDGVDGPEILKLTGMVKGSTSPSPQLAQIQHQAQASRKALLLVAAVLDSMLRCIARNGPFIK